jgi:hypothetical protein
VARQLLFTSEQHLRLAEALEAKAREEFDPELAVEFARKAALSRVCAELANLEIASSLDFGCLFQSCVSLCTLADIRGRERSAPEAKITVHDEVLVSPHWIGD